MALHFRRFLILFCLLVMVHQTILAQQQEAVPQEEAATPRIQVKPPVMQSIFWNTLLGSGWGALMGGTYSVIDKTVNRTEAIILGTTFGGLIGYGVGIILVIRGLSFDPDIIPESPFPKLRKTQANGFPQGWDPEIVPVFALKPHYPDSPKRAGGWHATLLQIQF